MTYSFHEREGAKLKLWDSHQAFEPQAMEQLFETAKLPFIHKHVAGMPDVHLGYGATIGSVIATDRALVPAAVGVDIGCGMVAVKLNLTASDLPDNLHGLRMNLEDAIPVGRAHHEWEADTTRVNKVAISQLGVKWDYIEEKYENLTTRNMWKQIGTLGGGNHFIELCLDEHQDVWLMLHSGSRGIGNVIGRFFIEQAKLEMERWHIADSLPNRDLAYLVENTELFDDYVQAMNWAQSYAYLNRQVMLDLALRVINETLTHKEVEEVDVAINCHHNYTEKENHFGKNVWITRKGAVRARVGDKGIIPGSMGTGSFIVEGLGNAESFCSCSHGAGRVMSRGKAKELISLDQHKEAMKGIEARVDIGVIDESPAAYKDITKVMAAQSDLVEIKYHLKQVLNIKG